MKIQDLLNKINGIQTIKSVMLLLDVDRQKAIYYVHRLRKKGYVKTMYGKDGMRVYSISTKHKLGGIGYYDIINKNAPEKVIPLKQHMIHGRIPSAEEALVFAITTQSFRTVLAALSLFRKIKNWTELYHIAKENNVEREVGALYELARKNIRKIRKMPKRYENHAKPKKYVQYRYIIKDIRSEENRDVEKNWKVYLPFNKKDLEAYT